MGKGDRKTKRGKLFKGTFGVTRPHKVKVTTEEQATPARKAAAKKKAAK